MLISREEFEQIVAEAMDELPEKFLSRMNNVAILVEDFPNKEQLTRAERKEKYSLFGLYEGYVQSRRLNFGAVTPDRITLFYRPIVQSCDNEEQCRERIINTLKHEIAHHFGSDERGARRAEKK